MATCDRRSEEKNQQEEAAKASFDRLDEKEKNMWKYSARKMLMSLGEDSYPESSLIENLAFDAWYEYSKRKRNGFFGIPKKEKVKYDKMDDEEKVVNLEKMLKREISINIETNPIFKKFSERLSAIRNDFEQNQIDLTQRIKEYCQLMEDIKKIGDKAEDMGLDLKGYAIFTITEGFAQDSSKEDLIELGDVIAGHQPGRISDEQITVADLTGVAVQDIQIAKAVHEALLQSDIDSA